MNVVRRLIISRQLLEKRESKVMYLAWDERRVHGQAVDFLELRERHVEFYCDARECVGLLGRIAAHG